MQKTASIIQQPVTYVRLEIKTTHSVFMFITRRQYLHILWSPEHPDHKRIVEETIDTATFFYIKH